jgi:hypothetical protein
VVTLDTSGYTASFADKNVGTSKPVTVAGMTIGGADVGNYTLTQPTGLTADITAKTITVTGVTANNKVYDGTTTATLNTGSATLLGVIPNDVVSLATAGATASFGTKDVGISRPVTVSGLALAGADAGNYSLTQPTGLTANITAKTVTASLVGTVEKTYDGTTTATLAPGNYDLSGKIVGDDVALNDPAAGAYDTKDVGTGKTVTVAAGLVLTGTDAGNYTLASDSASGPVGKIDAKALTVTGVTANNKVYDGTTAARLNTGTGALSGVVTGDVVTLNTGATTASFADPNVGTNKPVTVGGLALAGADAGNYSLTQPTGLTADITPATLSVTADAQTMTYGGPVPALTFTTGGLVGGDTAASVLTGALATTATSSSHVNPAGYPITQGTLVANGNYTINFTGSTLTINRAPLTITANDASKVYGAPLPGFTVDYSGFVNGDTAASLATPPSVTTAATSTSPAGSYPLNVAGASSGDYQITFVPGTLAITKAGTSAAVSSSLAAAVVGQATTFTVQVSPTDTGAAGPTGTVTFLVDGTPIGTAAVDAATGQATLTTTTLGHGTHAITASYSGDANFQGSAVSAGQAGSTQVAVTAARTQTVVTAQAVRNRRGRVTGVELVSRVLVVAPGSGVPAGSVTFFRRARRLRTQALSNGTSVLSLKLGQALNRLFSVQFGGSADFQGSSSAPVKVTRPSLKASVRPLIVSLIHGPDGRA